MLDELKTIVEREGDENKVEDLLRKEDLLIMSLQTNQVPVVTEYMCTKNAIS